MVSPADISGYARFFEKYTQDEDGNSILNPHWESNNEYNLMFIKAQERYANDLLKAKKRVFLNEVYEMLGLPRTKLVRLWDGFTIRKIPRAIITLTSACILII